MNTEFVLKMVSPFVQNGTLTHEDFDCIFNMLSNSEKCDVRSILDENNILLCNEYKNIQVSIAGNLTEEDFEKETDIKIIPQNKDEIVICHETVKQDNRVLIKMIHQGSRQAENDLCVKNANLVRSRAKKFVNLLGNDLELDDVIQFGYIGMIDAARRFDLTRENEFSTYAVYHIDACIRRGIVNNGFKIRIPVHCMDFVNKINRLNSEYEYLGYDHSETVKLISKELKISEEKIEDAFMIASMYLSIRSLDYVISENGDTTLGELISIKEKGPEEKAMSSSMANDIHKALDTLTPRESKVIKLRFGIDCDRSYTLEEVGTEFNVTRERIRQIEATALRKLRHPSRSKNLKEYMVG